MIIDILKNSRFVHLFTNTFLLLNLSLVRGGKNRTVGKLGGILCRTFLNIRGRGNIVEYGRGGKLARFRIHIRGDGNRVIIGDGCNISDAVIWISGDGNVIRIGGGTKISNAEFGLERDGNLIDIGKDSIVGGFAVVGRFKSATELARLYTCEGRKIIIGSRVGLSDGITIRTSDSHPLLNLAGERINPADDVTVGDGAWVCSRSTILKGARLADDSVLAFASVLTKDYSENKNVLLAGAPARIVREGVCWRLNF